MSGTRGPGRGDETANAVARPIGAEGPVTAARDALDGVASRTDALLAGGVQANAPVPADVFEAREVVEEALGRGYVVEVQDRATLDIVWGREEPGDELEGRPLWWAATRLELAMWHDHGTGEAGMAVPIGLATRLACSFQAFEPDIDIYEAGERVQRALGPGFAIEAYEEGLTVVPASGEKDALLTSAAESLGLVPEGHGIWLAVEALSEFVAFVRDAANTRRSH